MSRSKKIPTCGDFGGLNRSGKPCGRRVVEGLCRSHSEEGVAEANAQKADFLKEYCTGLVSLKAAAEKAGAAAVTVWRWRQHDPVFDAALGLLQANIDEIRLNMVEDTLVARCLKPETPPALIIFYLVNRSAGRWRHVQHIQQQQINVDLSNLTEEELQRVANGEDPVKVLSETRVPKGPQLVEEGAA